MPIQQYLKRERFDSETTRIIGLAFETARVALRDQERGDLTDETIAEHIVALAKAGERDVDRLCDYALAKLREPGGRLFQSSPASRRAASEVGFLDLSQSRDRPER